ncbi:hypothetical protein [Bradyrhizobium murdochi]|uniref:hypothetical protein n=1 Tax=Bradyrhizobium murdochi TaxID=1038859 RepID=UPI0024BFAFBF|nr:hypothetical protein [Bradyrhizobium murdochi]
MEENLRLANSIAAQLEQALTLSETDRAAGLNAIRDRDGHRDVAGDNRIGLSAGKISGRKGYSATSGLEQRVPLAGDPRAN